MYAYLRAYHCRQLNKRGEKWNMDRHLTVWHDDAGWGQFRAEYNDRRPIARRVCGDATENSVAADTVMLSNNCGVSMDTR